MISQLNPMKEKKIPTVNPYRIALELFVRRLFWDLHPFSWTSRKRMRTWKEKYAGQKAVILCNGPSLNHVDFRALKAAGVFTFGLNKINLLFDKTDFRPSAIVAVNPHVIEQNAGYYNQTQIPLFLDCGSKNKIRFRENVHFVHCHVPNGAFARDCSISVCQGFTVTYVAMQLAFYMGFNNVALAGCDHSFSVKGPANQTVVAKETDLDHFDPGYFKRGTKWQLPDLTQSEAHYEIARDTFERHGKKIVNCTVGSKLGTFEYQPLEFFLS